MFTCSVGDEIFGMTSDESLFEEERQKLQSRCKKLERDLARAHSAKADVTATYEKHINELVLNHERKMHEINASHAIEVSANKSAHEAAIDRHCDEIYRLESLVELYSGQQEDMFKRMMIIKRYMEGGETNDRKTLLSMDYFHMDATESEVAKSPGYMNMKHNLVQLPSGQLRSFQCLSGPLLEEALEDIASLVDEEISNRKACEHEFELIMEDYNELQKENTALRDQLCKLFPSRDKQI